MTVAMTEAVKNCDPKPLQILVEGNQTLPSQQKTTIKAIVVTTKTHDITGAVQPLPQFDESANIIVKPGLVTAHNKQINIGKANLTEFLYTVQNHIKAAELQILKPDDTKQMRPMDAATLKLLEDPDDTHIYFNEIMKLREEEKNDENFRFPTPKVPGKEDDHTPIQRRILEELRELTKKEILDPTEDTELRKANLSMFKWKAHT